MTTRYSIIEAWVLSCETELQYLTVVDFVENRLICDDKEKDDIKDMIILNGKIKDFLRNKVMSGVITEEQFTDIVSH